MLKDVTRLLAALRGTPRARATHATLRRRPPGPGAGLEILRGALPPTVDDDVEEPIFVFAAGWRSGSTLLQRLALSDPSLLLWGEPYDRCGLVPVLANMLRAFDREWPPAAYFGPVDDGDRLADRWVANLYPPLTALRAAHRAFFLELLGQPARARGAERWGFKEVRLGADAARYLNWLFPRARFCFLYRNPYDAWRSYRQRGAGWYREWPARPVLTPRAFGAMWRELTREFIDVAPAVGGLAVAYEALVSDPATVDRVEQYFGLQVDRTVLGKRVAGSGEARARPTWLPRAERWLLRSTVEPLATELGYHG
ncbi:MAG: sulfotransferase [Gammaproteobacteria bacterium]